MIPWKYFAVCAAIIAVIIALHFAFPPMSGAMP